MSDHQRHLERLDDLVDGALAPAAAAEVEAHLAACAACAAERDALLGLRRAAAALPRAVAPPRDLWPAIAARTVRRRSWAVPQALAASLTLAIVAAALMQPAERAAPAVVAAQPAPQGRALFVAQVVRADPAVPSATRAVVEHNLKLIQQALAEIEQAVERNPDDPGLRQLLVSIHIQESALMERMQRVTVEANRRTDI